MLDNLVTPIVAIAVILGITFPIWSLILLARFVRNTGRIADALEGVSDVLHRARIYGEVDDTPRVFAQEGLGQPK